MSDLELEMEMLIRGFRERVPDTSQLARAIDRRENLPRLALAALSDGYDNCARQLMEGYEALLRRSV